MVAIWAMSSCDKEPHYINPRNVKLTNVMLECINEVDGVKDPTSGLEYTQHSFLCTGSLSGSTGNYHIEISDPLWEKCVEVLFICTVSNKDFLCFNLEP